MAKKILIVDDEPDILELLCEEFEYEGFEVVQAISGNQAIHVLKSDDKVDAVVSDYKMPDGNGKVLLDFINNELSYKPVFYFVSGQADMTFDDALEQGASMFFHKPFDLEELIEALKKDLA